MVTSRDRIMNDQHEIEEKDESMHTSGSSPAALSTETETALAIRAQAHAILALAAATAIDPDRQREEWRDVAGGRYADTWRRSSRPGASVEADDAKRGPKTCGA